MDQNGSIQGPFDPGLLTGAQLRAARALLSISGEELARLAQVGFSTVKRAESTDGLVGVRFPIRLALVRVLEARGVEFIPANGGGAGVRLRGVGQRPQ
jgi:transcriptional regulator with XRE-family HTH domain